MPFAIESITSQATYESLKSLNDTIDAETQRGPGSLLEKLSSDFNLSYPPSLGARLKAGLSGFRFIAWLAPSWKQAREYCDLFDQRQRNVRELLTNQRKLLLSEFGDEVGVRQALSTGNVNELPKYLRDRPVREFRDTASLVDDLRAVSRSVALYESTARGTYENWRKESLRDTPMTSDRTRRSFTYGAMNQALDSISGLTAKHRGELLAGFRSKIEAFQAQTMGVALSPKTIEEACHDYLLEKGLVTTTPQCVEQAQVVWHLPDNKHGLTSALFQTLQGSQESEETEPPSPVNWNPAPADRPAQPGRSIQSSAPVPVAQEVPAAPLSQPLVPHDAEFDSAALAFWAHRFERADASGILPKDERALAMRAALLVEMRSRITDDTAFSATSSADDVQRIEASYARRCRAGAFLDGGASLSDMSRAARASVDEVFP